MEVLLYMQLQGLHLSAVCVGPRRGTEDRFSNDAARSHHDLQSCITMIMAQPRRYMNFPQRKSLSSPVTYKSLMALNF